MKIITTAVFSVFILSKRLNSFQWIAIVLLTCGVALVQLSQLSKNPESKTNSFTGFLSVIFGCLTSGFAGNLLFFFFGLLYLRIYTIKQFNCLNEKKIII
jgi:drug/metabolite transporter (DMT)-like permease